MPQVEVQADGPVGSMTLSARPDATGTPPATATLERVPGGWSLGFGEPDPDLGLALEIVMEATSRVAGQGGGRLTMWRSNPSPISDDFAVDAGFESTRDLLQFRRPLPLPPSSAPDLPVRSFVPGQDEDAWLQVNNRAFDWHPEQGGWDRSVIEAREAEPWFDPAGFLLYEQDGRLGGFCWTKIHTTTDPELGEIYVIGVDPSLNGHGLGRRLSIAGLDYLSRRGITLGMLYVDETNSSARKMYDHLGFRLDHVDRGYTKFVDPLSQSR